MNMRAGVTEIRPNELAIIEQVAEELGLMARTRADDQLAASLRGVLEDIRARRTLVCQ